MVVEEPKISASFSISGSSYSDHLQYPRVIRKKKRVEHLEIKLEIDLLRQFSGLSGAQRNALVKLIDTNARIRKAAGLETGIFERIDDEMYDLTFDKVELTHRPSFYMGDLIKSVDASNDGSQEIKGHDDRGYESEPGPIISTNDWDEDYAADDEDGTRSESYDDFFDLEFPIEEYELKSKANEDSDGKEAPKERKAKVDVARQHNQLLKQRYSHLVDNRKLNAFMGETMMTKNDLDQEALMEMKMVSSDLQKWVHEVLDKSIKLDPEVLSEVNRLAEAEDERNKDSGQPKRVAKDVSVLDRVDVSGFDVLLNACKPSILEAKPPVRLNVVHEMNPPEALASSLPTQSGSARKGKQTGLKSFPEVDSSFTYREKIRKTRPHYGAWYLPTKVWGQNMQDFKDGSSKKKMNSSTSKKFGGIVQEKLDEINRKRQADYSEFMKEM